MGDVEDMDLSQLELLQSTMVDTLKRIQERQRTLLTMPVSMPVPVESEKKRRKSSSPSKSKRRWATSDLTINGRPRKSKSKNRSDGGDVSPSGRRGSVIIHDVEEIEA